jgi:hypothetical protein
VTLLKEQSNNILDCVFVRETEEGSPRKPRPGQRSAHKDSSSLADHVVPSLQPTHH